MSGVVVRRVGEIELFELRQMLRQGKNDWFLLLCVWSILTLSFTAAVVVAEIGAAAVRAPIPYRDPQRLVHVMWRAHPARVTLFTDSNRVADLREQTDVFEQMEMHVTARLQPASDDPRAGYWVAKLSPGFLRLLGVEPRLGRFFDEVQGATESDAAIISYSLWRRAFGQRSDILNESLTLQGHRYRIVGVAPASFRYLEDVRTDLWLPLLPNDPDIRSAGVIARLRTGAGDSRGDLRAASQLVESRRTADVKWRVELFPIDSSRGDESTSRVVAALEGAAAVLVLVAAATATNLLSSRAAARRLSVSIMLCLGASRRRIAMLLAIESAALALLAVIGGVLAAWWVIGVVPESVPSQFRYVLFASHLPALDTSVVAMSVAAAVGIGIVMGLVACARVLRGNPAAVALSRVSARFVGAAHTSHLDWLVAIQAGLFIVVMITAGLLLRSVVRMSSVEAGFEPRGLVYVDIALSPRRYSTIEQRELFFDSLLEAVKRNPLAVAAAFGSSPAGGSTVSVSSAEIPEADARLNAHLYSAGPDYFKVTGIHIQSGRSLLQSDRIGTPPVAIISRSTARHLWGDGPALGREIRYAGLTHPLIVVGIANDVITPDFTDLFPYQIYVALAQNATPARQLLLRSADVPSVLRMVQRELRSIDSQEEIRRAGVVADAYTQRLAPARFYAAVAAFVAVFALITTAFGVYGLVRHRVETSRHDLGIMIALGARGPHLRKALATRVLVTIIVGLSAGMVVSLWVARSMRSLLYHLEPHDPLTIGGAILLCGAVVVAAALPPFRVMLRIDPVEMLRAE